MVTTREVEVKESTVFRKKIIQPGTYHVPKKGGGTTELKVDRSRIAGWSNTLKKMLDNGLQIPAPWQHDKSEPTFTQNGSNTQPSKDNAGYWRKFWVEKDGSFYGELEVANPEDAKKVGTNVTEVSPYIRPNWVDGKANQYEDVFTHVALVTHPVIPGQSNFEEVTSNEAEPSIALSLSMLDPDFALSNNSTAEELEQFDSILQGLRQIGIVLPDDTTAETFLERLQVSLLQRASDLQETKKAGSVTTPPAGATEQAAPLVMSADTEEVKERKSLLGKLKDLLIPPTKNPNTTTDENVADQLILDAESRTPKDKEKMTTPLISENNADQNSPSMLALKKQIRKGYENRILKLHAEGKISASFANQELQPMLNDLALSLDAEGNAAPTTLDTLLKPLEALPALANFHGKNLDKQPRTQTVLGQKQNTALSMTTEELLPDSFTTDENSPVDEERAEELVSIQFKNSGLNAGA